MTKIPRNAPCPCGSGKKYKTCCLPGEAAARAEAAAGQRARAATPATLSEDDPTELSNHIVDLIDAGKLEEADAACAELEATFPEIIDWIERRGMIHEARGENEKAIAAYRQCLAHIEENRDLYDEGFEDWYLRSIRKLEERLTRDREGMAAEGRGQEHGR